MKYTFTAAALMAVAVANPIPDSVSASPPSYKITNVISGGSGCPQGSIDIDFTDSKILPIRFSKDFTAAVGPNVSADQSRKNCQINVALQFSPGWQYAVYSADYSGFADLDSGANAAVKAKYYFSGETDDVSSTLNINGPYTGKYTKHDDLDILVYSPCGSSAMFNVDASVALTPLGGAAGTMTATKESGKFTHNLYVQWRQC